MNKTDHCDIIRDLLPGYIDDILSEAGTNAVKEHLKHCEECNLVYREMDEALCEKTTPVEQAALNGFKKIRKRTRKLKLAIWGACGLLMLFAAGFFLKYFVIGEPLTPGDISISEISYDEEAETLSVSGTMNLALTRITRVIWETDEADNNAVNILIYAADTLPCQQEKRDFTITIPDMKGKKAYLARPKYDRLQIYHWQSDHYKELAALEEEIYTHFPQLDRTKDVLTCSLGIEIVDGMEGLLYSVETVVGENAAFWWSPDGKLTTDGDLEPRDFDIWISLDTPRRILLFDYKTGAYTEDPYVFYRF